jgi:hypothetical protein
MRSYRAGDTGAAVGLWREVVRLDANTPLGKAAQDAITTVLMTEGR